MKKTNIKIIYIFVLSATLFITSCSEDKLDILPEIGTPLEEAITNENDMKMVLNGVYSNMASSSGFGAAVPIFGDLLSDNTYVTNDSTNGGYFLNTSRMTYSPEISDFGMYDSFYDVIQQTNMVIGDKTLTETTTVLNYKAEAKIARAMSYFYLLCFYSPDPKSGVNQEYGVPIQPEKYDPNNRLARATVSEVYDYIISDLQNAISQLGNVAPSKKSYLGSTAAKLLLSRIYLTRGSAGDYQKAVDYANEVINNSPASFKPITASGYGTYFNGTTSTTMKNQPETIFEIEQTSQVNMGGNAHPATFYASLGSHRSLLFRPSFTNTFEKSDIRQQLIGTAGSAQDSPKGNFCKKWVRSTSDESAYASNIRLLRFSEAYLNRIEALFKMGETATAQTYLNDFEKSRNETVLTMSISLEKILNERRKEFFGEGYRYFDLKRNGLGIIKDSNCNDNCTVSADNRLFVIPMPYYEINVNQNITQYPDWR